MTDLFLIAHKVRGEPAFDVAHQMECPECMPVEPSAHHLPVPEEGCVECDGNGYWWIIPTSGHRAYPWWHITFDDLAQGFLHEDIPPMPPGLPDHYPTRAAPTVSLIDALGLRKPKAGIEDSPTQSIARRF